MKIIKRKQFNSVYVTKMCVKNGDTIYQAAKEVVELRKILEHNFVLEFQDLEFKINWDTKPEDIIKEYHLIRHGHHPITWEDLGH